MDAMSPRPIRWIFFDLYQTLAFFDETRLPVVELPVGPTRSTLGEVHEIYIDHGGTMAMPEFLVCVLEVSRGVRREAAESMQEITSFERFRRIAIEAGVDPGEREEDGVARRMMERHMKLLIGSADIPSLHRDMIQRLGMTYGVGLISNFDHGPAARELLDRTAMTDLLDPIVISDEEGLIKPNPEIFRRALQRAGADPGETVFVGDNPHDDVVGARSADIDVAWISPNGDPFPEGGGGPTWTIRSVLEIEDIINAGRKGVSVG